MQILPPAEQVLHSQETKRWFNTRHGLKVKEVYKKTEKELHDDKIVTETFHLIDRDHSNTIELDELYTMLVKNHYPVNMSLLKDFFEKTDKDGNNCIDLDEFKQVVKDEATSHSIMCTIYLVFRTMMRKMRDTGEENFYSTDFVNLLRYLSYCSNRTDLIWQIKNTRLPLEVRSKLVSQLLKVNQQFTKLQQQDEKFQTLMPFMKKRTQTEIKYHTPIRKKPNFLSTLSTKTRISTSNQNSIISLQAPSLMQFSPRLSPLKTDRYIVKKKMSLAITPLLSTKSTLHSTTTKSFQKKTIF